ncbi:unnamed protein product [Vitrella brassicaformis CCMP3155]|uniref:Uncharacterized protein n=1 Tax=Vitrella brassicaformis (strain CCMP3155) TaxID=1169540 RepID=A0A0G4GKK3_VITBC|nr:unnamed protein product [Vitrella brassicaformis CCMP3155]|eukprot:CEM30523.1 unnamed protein product [Vitrella brassicaformis CCMP3155]
MKVFCLLLLIALAGVANCQIRRLQAEPAPRFIGENGEEVEVAPEEVDRVNRLNAISTVLMENAAEGIEVVMHGDRVFTRTGGGDEDDPRMKLLNLPAWYADISEPVERDSNGTNVTSEQAPCPKIHGPQFIFPVSAGQTRTIRSSVNPRAFDAHNWKLTSLGRMRLEICEIQLGFDDCIGADGGTAFTSVWVRAFSWLGLHNYRVQITCNNSIIPCTAIVVTGYDFDPTVCNRPSGPVNFML